jgi:hypothetical protein
VWQIVTMCAGEGETVDGNAWSAAAVAVAANKAVANQISTVNFSATLGSGCSAGKELYFRFLRDPGHAADDLNATAELLSLRFTVRRMP